MKVAFSSSNGEMLDQQFSNSALFWIWEIVPRDARCLERVAAPQRARTAEERLTARAEALKSCSIVYTTQIGNPAAAKLVARNVFPMKTQAAVPIAALVERLQSVMQDNPPPWMRKVLGMPPAAVRTHEEPD